MRAEAFRTGLADAVARARREHRTLSVVWFDADECAVANQDFGEHEVDEALFTFHKVLSARVGERGECARMEGAAFAVRLDGMTKPDALRWAEAARQALSQLKHPSHDETFSLALSAGVAELRAAEPALNLLEAAELSCVRAKQAGRGQVVGR